MRNINIKFDLYCDWSISPPTYRLYVNDELVTEREYIWSNDEYVLQENIPMLVDLRQNNCLRLEQINPKSGNFEIKNLSTGEDTVNINVIIN